MSATLQEPYALRVAEIRPAAAAPLDHPPPTGAVGRAMALPCLADN